MSCGGLDYAATLGVAFVFSSNGAAFCFMTGLAIETNLDLDAVPPPTT